MKASEIEEQQYMSVFVNSQSNDTVIYVEQREGKGTACLQQANQATGPTAAQRKRNGGNDCMTEVCFNLAYSDT